MEYEFITRLPSEALQWGSPELKALAQVWLERRSEMEKMGSLDAFRTRLKREWAIETGIIERLYTWDRGVTEVLISQGVDAAIISHRTQMDSTKAAYVVHLIRDQESVVEGMHELLKSDNPLSEYDIRAMHQLMTAHQNVTEAVDKLGRMVDIPLLKGKYKEHPNNPRRADGSLHFYCPPEHVDSEMANLVRWFNELDAAEPAFPTEVLSAWLHHRFTQIHPFQDGNGRIARALATLVFLQRHMFPLVIRDEDRKNYIAALEDADSGDLLPLTQLFANRQKAAILAALGLEQQTAMERRAELVFRSVIRERHRKTQEQEQAFQRVYETAEHLAGLAEERLSSLAEMANIDFKEIVGGYRADVRRASDEDSGWYRREIVEGANRLDYFANFDAHRDWVRLTILTREIFVLLISFHGFGHTFQGVLSTSAMVFRRVEDEDRRRVSQGIELATPEVFQFNYAEQVQESARRFGNWLEDAMTLAMGIWQRSPGV